MQCVKFVYTHGVMTEGIYRLAGGNTKINRLLSQFRSNAWAVQISREDYRSVSSTWSLCNTIMFIFQFEVVITSEL